MSTKIIKNTFIVLGVPFFKLITEISETSSPTERKAPLKPVETPKPLRKRSCDPNRSVWSPEANAHGLER